MLASFPRKHPDFKHLIPSHTWYVHLACYLYHFPYKNIHNFASLFFLLFIYFMYLGGWERSMMESDFVGIPRSEKCTYSIDLCD